MWRDIVPQLAHQHNFLMHAFLACTALHMAHLNPNRHQELTLKARTHQDHAMPLFRAAIPSVEDENCDAVLIFARMVAINAFALDEHLFIGWEKEDKLPSWLFFIRSGCKYLTFRGISLCLAIWGKYYNSRSTRSHKPSFIILKSKSHR